MSRRCHHALLLVATCLVAILMAGCGTPQQTSRATPSVGLDAQVDACVETAIENGDSALTACIAQAARGPILRAHGAPDSVERVTASINRYPKLAIYCHTAMHQVGRAVALQEKLGIDDLMGKFPSGGDRICVPGYIHGLMIGVNDHLSQMSPKQARRLCAKATSANRRYACVHGFGHVYSRQHDNDVFAALNDCARLGGYQARDCSQGAFHDLQIARTGEDGTHPVKAISPQALCMRVATPFIAPCWFRMFWENPELPPITSPESFRAACADVSQPNQRGACYAAAVFSAVPDPYAQIDACALLSDADARGCINGVDPHAAMRDPGTLLAYCDQLSTTVRNGCVTRLARLISAINWAPLPDALCAALHGHRKACRDGVRLARTPLSDGFPSDEVHSYGGYGGDQEPPPTDNDTALTTHPDDEH